MMIRLSTLALLAATTALAALPAAAIEMDLSGGVSMGLIGTSGDPISPYASLDTRFDFSIETDGGLTIGLTIPLTSEATDDGWTIRISDQ